MRSGSMAGRLLVAAAACGVVGFTGAAEATLIGLPSTAGKSYATWDTFAPNPLPEPLPYRDTINRAPDVANTSIITATLSNNFPGTNGVTGSGSGGSYAGSGDRMYQGNGAGDVAFDTSVTFTPSQNVDVVRLAVKFSRPNQTPDTRQDPAVTYTFDNFFTASLIGSSATPTFTNLGTTGEILGSGQNASPIGVVTFDWTNISLSAGQSYTIALTSPDYGHASIDAIQVAVPEPASLGLIGLAAAALLRRRPSV